MTTERKSLINDGITIGNVVAIDKQRMDYFIPNYLCKFLREGDILCSAGCGTAYDVELLNDMGFDAYGFDPGNRTKAWASRSPSVQRKLAVAFPEHLPFGEKRFSFIYALEVLEHVGCLNGEWKLEKDYKEIRIAFLENCLKMLMPQGRLLLSTSNRLFPFDVGHGHHYTGITDWFARKGLRLTIPWHPKNFTLSYKDIKVLLKGCSPRTEIRQISPVGYAANSRGRYGKIRRAVNNAFIGLLSVYPMVRINPILVVLVTKK